MSGECEICGEHCVDCTCEYDEDAYCDSCIQEIEHCVCDDCYSDE